MATTLSLGRTEMGSQLDLPPDIHINLLLLEIVGTLEN